MRKREIQVIPCESMQPGTAWDQVGMDLYVLPGTCPCIHMAQHGPEPAGFSTDGRLSVKLLQTQAAAGAQNKLNVKCEESSSTACHCRDSTVHSLPKPPRRNDGIACGAAQAELAACARSVAAWLHTHQTPSTQRPDLLCSRLLKMPASHLTSAAAVLLQCLALERGSHVSSSHQTPALKI